MLVLDAGAVTALAERSTLAAARIAALRAERLWPPIVPSVVLVECLRGDPHDARANRLLKACAVVEAVPTAMAREAARLRRLARRGSAVDALVTALAQPGGVVLTTDPRDLRALAAHATGVDVRPL